MVKSLEDAQVEWQQGSALSRRFDDVYFSRVGGLDEAEYVFLAGNELPARWQSGKEFTIVETGFGTGLNFVATLARWRQRKLTGARLSYVAIEGYPLAKADIARIGDAWPALKDDVDALCDQLPPREPGQHSLVFDDGRVQLTLIYGLLAETLENLTNLDLTDSVAEDSAPLIDAWYLDGFSPGRNPEMWTPALFTAMGQLSRAGTTVATFTIARMVRDGLEEAGFELARTPGFGSKRDMLRGVRSPELIS